MKLYLQVLALIRPYWRHVILVIGLTLLYVLFNNLSLWVSVDFVRELFTEGSGSSAVGRVTEISGAKDIYGKINAAIKSYIIQDNKFDTLLVVCFVIFLAFLLKNITQFSRRVLLTFVELNIVVNLRNALHKKLMHLPLGYFSRRHSGDLTSVVFNDVNAINSVLHNSFGNLILAPIQIITNIVILFLISVKLALITLTIVPVSAILITKIGQSMRRKSRRVFKQIANVVSTFQETVSAIRIVKAFTSEDREENKFRDANRDYFKKYFKAQRLNHATSPINETFFVTILVLLLWYGGSLVYNNQGLNAEDFLRFLLFLFMIFEPLKQLSGINNSLQNGLAAAERIFDVLDMESEPYKKDGGKTITKFRENIVFENVSFRYGAEEDEVLKNVNLEIKKGEMVAFVGHSGSGKSTLLNLIPRFYEAGTGHILIDGNDIAEYKLVGLRNIMGIVTQDTILFNDTIGKNIAYGMDEVSEAEIVEAAKIANAWEFIDKLPDKLDSQIGEKGTRLSGGQKQRLSIARAVLKNPDILILDEATSALDSESEKLVQEAIDKLLESRTVLVIAHRLSTITNANKIVVMNNGLIEDIGTHNELLERCPTYQNLTQNQFIEARQTLSS